MANAKTAFEQSTEDLLKEFDNIDLSKKNKKKKKKNKKEQTPTPKEE